MSKSTGWLLAFAILGGGVHAACGNPELITNTSSSSSSGHGGSVASAADGAGGTGGTLFATGVGGASSAGGMMQGFDVQPSALQAIDVNANQQTPTVTYHATLDGKPVSAGWALDRGDVGTIPAGPSADAVFAPSGKAGGLVTVQAGLNGMLLKRQIMVQLKAQQNGLDAQNPLEQAQVPMTLADLTAGGGVGGVGGEGLGPAIGDAALLAALDAPVGDGSAQGLKYIYPYDKTVWPRGLPAPLLMWDWANGDADGIKIEIKTQSGSFAYKGTFGRPQILAMTGGKFIRHPIAQDIWDIATNSAGGSDALTVSLTVAQGGMAYGPISETWTIAKARLSGIIYYQSYGTQLAQNFSGAKGGNGKFGGAVLSIHVGDSGPKLTAGANGGSDQCRVCHSVAANGSRLVVQHGDSYGTSSAYDLTPNGAVENVLATGMTFPGLYPDGSTGIAANGSVLPLPNNAMPVATSGLTATNLGAPAFSPDGALIVFNPLSDPSLMNPKQKLAIMSFNQATGVFSNEVVVADFTGQPAETRPGWPAFFPDSKSIVFQQQTAAGLDGNGQGDLATRKGARGEIDWTSLVGPMDVTPLNQLNGKDMSGASYLPKLATPINMTCTADGAQVGGIDPDHGDDVDLNYEPTVNPVASGGYAWVVFTSRRLYGNEATIPPFCSDPRGVDLIQNITTKKLWVSAIDLSAAPGTDSSHPAFYLPSQELLAGNARGFWVLDPCKPDGSACSTGDQCCNGYCEPDMNGQLSCSNIPPNSNCSKPMEKCTTGADCCDANDVCIGGFCTQKGIN